MGARRALGCVHSLTRPFLSASCQETKVPGPPLARSTKDAQWPGTEV
ncbi:unnamed protein product [Pararhodospirillum photometricum DSM 122]|uniref:Uncharacterized protein n=1 Tax=Pararhodospirillum photometricum DSM 122 TaxID=1150469 RepID=H6SQT3_PARPM|nr:unnamed protein product [Pararhodospirillum photometricum DSM 122]